ncbi:MAG: GNAT family N-acetyltransferase [Candidatus Xenobia bacterium]
MIRQATVQDADFIRKLSEQSIIYGVMPTRSIRPEQVQDIVRRLYVNIEAVLESQRPVLVFIAEAEVDGTQQPVGYIMLDFNMIEPATGERQCFIADLAVSREYWGHGTTQRLIDHAAKLTKAKGLRYLVGHVSANNARTLKIAQEVLDFKIERHQIVKICD